MFLICLGLFKITILICMFFFDEIDCFMKDELQNNFPSEQCQPLRLSTRELIPCECRVTYAHVRHVNKHKLSKPPNA